MLSFRNCIAAAVGLVVAVAATAGAGRDALAQTPGAQPAAGETEFTIFLRGTPIGREQVQVARSGDGWIITASGQTGAPFELTLHRLEMKYTPDWQPLELLIDAAQRNTRLDLKTSFGLTTAINEITENAVTNSRTDQISARAIVLANNFYAPYEALAARLAGTRAGAELPVYVAPQGEVKVTVRAVHEEQIATPGAKLATRRYDIVIHNPGGPLAAVFTIDHRSRFVRLEIPTTGLTVARTDVAGVGTRTQTARNPTDVDVTIPANGFNIAGTLTLPPATAGRLRHPAVILVSGSTMVDRDETIAGIPIFSQLAWALAQRGFTVLRYDKRGIGQSGGRPETVTLQDYADDVLSVVRWMSKRKDVDKKRIALAGRGDGGSVAMIAARREEDIASLVLVATPGTTGAELILEQQRHALELLETPADERQEKIDLQLRIHKAVVTGDGWLEIPEDIRRQADTPLFRSILLFDPAQLMSKVKQPVLVIQPELDRQIPIHHGTQLAELARARKKAKPVEYRQLAGLNHLLVRAATGEVSEYASLKERVIAAEVGAAIAAWLGK
jgi:uncharacterized protein